MNIQIKQKLINEMVKVFKKRKNIFKIGIMIGERTRDKVTIKRFIYPNQTHKEKGMVAEISSTEYSKVINKFGKKAIGLIFYMRKLDACDTVENRSMRRTCAMFGMIDLSLAINAKGKHNFFSGEKLEVKVE